MSESQGDCRKEIMGQTQSKEKKETEEQQEEDDVIVWLPTEEIASKIEQFCSDDSLIRIPYKEIGKYIKTCPLLVVCQASKLGSNSDIGFKCSKEIDFSSYGGQQDSTENGSKQQQTDPASSGVQPSSTAKESNQKQTNPASSGVQPSSTVKESNQEQTDPASSGVQPNSTAKESNQKQPDLASSGVQPSSTAKESNQKQTDPAPSGVQPSSTARESNQKQTNPASSGVPPSSPAKESNQKQTDPALSGVQPSSTAKDKGKTDSELSGEQHIFSEEECNQKQKDPASSGVQPSSTAKESNQKQTDPASSGVQSSSTAKENNQEQTNLASSGVQPSSTAKESNQKQTDPVSSGVQSSSTAKERNQKQTDPASSGVQSSSTAKDKDKTNSTLSGEYQDFSEQDDVFVYNPTEEMAIKIEQLCTDVSFTRIQYKVIGERLKMYPLLVVYPITYKFTQNSDCGNDYEKIYKLSDKLKQGKKDPSRNVTAPMPKGDESGQSLFKGLIKRFINNNDQNSKSRQQSKPIEVQFLIAIQTATTKDFPNAIQDLFKDISFKCTLCARRGGLSDRSPLVVVCPISSRFESDIDSAIDGLEWKNTFVVLLLHSGLESSLPRLPTSSKLAHKEKYKNIAFIDIAYNIDSKLHRCQMNENAKEQLKCFLQNFTRNNLD